MRFTWDDSAKRGLYQVAEYIKDNFGVKSLKKFRQELVHTTDLIASNPYMCALEPLLSERESSYRSALINNLSKMVYFVDEEKNTIHIVAFWDCRCEPLTQIEHLE